jgi:O-methyltransferase
MSEPILDSQSYLDILRSERRDVLNRLRQTQFSTLKEGYTQTQIIPYASYSPWRDDKTFLSLFTEVKDCTLVDIYRCHELYALARQMRSSQGAFVEVGVWRGGTGALMAGAAPEKVVHLFDTFTGVTKANSAHDTLYAGGEHADTDPKTVEGLFHRLGLRCKANVGVFPEDTLHNLPATVSLAHIDVDTYASTKDSFFAIWPVVQACGVMVFDDYGFFGCEGVAEAVNEIKANISDAVFVHNLNGHAILIKCK